MLHSRKPSLPSFWRSEKWSECLPPPSSTDNHPGLPAEPEIIAARLVISALDPHEITASPVPLSEAMRAAQSLDDWFRNSASKLTWPPSSAGFSAAAQELFTETAFPEQRWVLGLLDALRPDLVSIARHDYEVSGQTAWFTKESILSQSAKIEDKESSPSPNDFSNSQLIAHSPAATMIIGWLGDLRSRSENSLPLLQEELDGKIKRAVISSKGTGIRARNYWFEDVMIPALLELPLEDMQDLNRFWPPHQKCSFNDPVKAMEGRTLWGGLRGMDPLARRYLLTELLPSLVSSTDWTDQQRLDMLDPLVSRIKDHPGLVRQRLDLWEAWGGSLDQDVPLPMEEGALRAPTTSARNWLISAGLDPAAPVQNARRRRGPGNR